MGVIVIGGGRSGTNIVLEMLRQSPSLDATTEVEDKLFARRGMYVYPGKYLSKCDTHYLTWDKLQQTLENNLRMSVVFTIRDPRDMCMSKIYRGQPGHDTPVLSEDATIEGCIESIEHMLSIYRKLIQTYQERLHIIRMEHVLRDPENVAERLCVNLSIEYSPEMPKFYNHMRNWYKAKRYKYIDTNQIGMWQHWAHMYDGFFLRYPMEDIFKRVYYMVKELGYE